jgi:hypothetical protein
MAVGRCFTPFDRLLIHILSWRSFKMGREKDNRVEGHAGAFVEVEDVDGNRVRLPMDRFSSNYAVPQKDSDGNIPEFVNISGVRQQMVLPNDPNNTIKIEPWGILRGAQWRSFSEPAPAWGSYPKFMERKRRADGAFDPAYLLQEQQVIAEVLRLHNSDPGFSAYKRLEGWEANGKVHEFDKSGRMLQKDYTEDRGPAMTAISKQLSHLRKAWEVEKKNRGMGGIAD